MNDRTRQYVCLGVAVVLIITGTFATGLLPTKAFYQALAGSLIVAGFAVSFVCLSDFTVRE